MIRSATPTDARAIALVQVAGWHVAYRGLIPDGAGRVIAFATSGPSRDEPGVGEVWALYAAPDTWGTGAGRALLDDALRFLENDGFPSATLRVLAGTARAIRFYECASFHTVGEPFEEDGLLSLRMRCWLPRAVAAIA